MRILPCVVFQKRIKSFSSVDLPLPDEPMMLTNSPSKISNETPFKACTSSLPTMKVRFRFSTFMMEFAIALKIILDLDRLGHRFCCYGYVLEVPA